MKYVNLDYLYRGETKDGRILNISDTYKKDVRARYSKLLWDGDV